MLELTGQYGSQVHFYPGTIYVMEHYFIQLNAGKSNLHSNPAFIVCYRCGKTWRKKTSSGLSTGKNVSGKQELQSP